MVRESTFTNTYGSWGAVIAAAALVAGSFYFWPMREQATQARTASLMTVLPARIEPVALFQISSRIPGTVSAVFVDVGREVNPGDKLMEIVGEEVGSEVEKMRAREKVAESKLKAARAGSGPHQAELLKEQHQIAKNVMKVQRERVLAFSLAQHEQALSNARLRTSEVRQLFNDHLASRQELDEFEARERTELRNLQAAQEHQSRLKQELEAAESQVRLIELQMRSVDGLDIQAAKAELDEARRALAYAEARAAGQQINAEKGGTVLEIAGRPGEYIVAGTRLFTIADVSKLSVEVSANAMIARQLQIGDAVVVRLPGDPPERVQATISAVTLVPDQIQRTYIVKVVIPNPTPGTVLAGLDAAVEFPHLRP